jgi:hypothetical protein
MAVTISGSTGIAGVDGSAGTPAVQGADTNTGMFFPAADTIAFAEGGVESMRINSSGNVGIGTTSPSGKFHVSGGRSYFTASSEQFDVALKYNAATSGVWLGSPGTDAFTVSTEGGTERMRVDASGNVGIGTSSPASFGGTNVQIQSSGASAYGSLLVGSGTRTFEILVNDTSNVLAIGSRSNHTLTFCTNDTTRASIDTSGNFILNSAGSINLNTLNTYTASGNGYQKLPSGIIIQWGKTASISTGGNAAVTFPVAFPAACWVVLSTLEVASGSNSFGVSHGTPSTTGVTLYSNGSVAGPHTWIAIGN